MSNHKVTKRFTSEKTARDFAARVGGEFSDLREYSERKSDFKVTYERNIKRSHDSDYPGHDFDSSLNMNGMSWHTADDL